MSKQRTPGARIAVKPLAAVVAMAVAHWTVPAQAQEAPTNPNQLQTVLVTANKRVERLENVPESISVLSEAEIQRNNVREIEAILGYVDEPELIHRDNLVLLA